MLSGESWRSTRALGTNAGSARRDMILLIVVLVCAAAIRLYHFHGFNGFDDAEYAHFAHQIVRGEFEPRGYTGPSVFPLRVGVIIPAALSFRLFGMSEHSMVLYPLLLSLAGILLVYVFSAELFGRVAGLIAAAVLAIVPGDFDIATQLLPDLPAAFFAALAVTTILMAERRFELDRWRLFAAGAAAGLCLGLAWLCKESIAYLAPFCVLWIAIRLREKRWQLLYLWTGVAVGSIALLVGEMAVYAYQHGDALFRFHEIERNYRQWESSFFTEGSDFGWKTGESRAHALMHRLFVSGPATILQNRTLLFMPLLGVIATVHAWRSRDRRYLIPALWLWTLVLMLNFSSSSTSVYTPLALFQRYLYPLLFPAVVLVAGLLATTLTADVATADARRDHRRSMMLLGAAVALFVVWVGGRQLVWSLRSSARWYDDVWAVAPRVDTGTPIYSDALSLRGLEFRNRFPPSTAWVDLGGATAATDIPDGSLVLINPAAIQWLNKNAGMWVAWPTPRLTRETGYPLRLHYEALPPSWMRLWSSGDVALYRAQSSPPSPTPVATRIAP